MKTVNKLHMQLACLSISRLLSLLKDVGLLDENVKVIAEEILKGCNVCKRYKQHLLDLPLGFCYQQNLMKLLPWT